MHQGEHPGDYLMEDPMFPRLSTTRSPRPRGALQAGILAMHRSAARVRRLSLVLSLGLAVSLLASTIGTGYALPVNPPDPPDPTPTRGSTPTPTPPPTCFGLTATIVMTAPGTVYGTAGRDVIVGTPGNDVIYGLAGDDVICGMGGNDMIYGGDGNDRISGMAGTDTVDGGRGLDSCYAEVMSNCEFPVRITQAQVEDTVKGQVDAFIAGTDLYFGHIYGRPVEAVRKDNDSLSVDLDLAYSVDYWFDPEVDVDFDLDFSCSGGKISTLPSHFRFNVDSAWYSELLSLGIAQLSDSIASGVLNGISRLFEEALGTTSDLGFKVCPTVFVQSNGDVVFDFPLS